MTYAARMAQDPYSFLSKYGQPTGIERLPHGRRRHTIRRWLTPLQWAVFLHLYDEGWKRHTLADIARATGMSKRAVQRVLDALERMFIIERRAKRGRYGFTLIRSLRGWRRAKVPTLVPRGTTTHRREIPGTKVGTLDSRGLEGIASVLGVIRDRLGGTP